MRRLSPLALLCTLVACSSNEPSPSPSNAEPEGPWTPPACSAPAFASAPLSTRCSQLVDAEGRVVLLRGLNARVRGIFDADLGPGKVPLMPPIPVVDAADLARMRRVGFDFLRLPIHWSAIEPEEHEPPAFDESYLDRVVALVEAAKAAGVLVLLDFHQDAWSKWIGQDGAPLWAIVPAPEKILEGPLDDLSERVLSQQVQRAFGTFMSRTSDDGARLRRHFAAVAARVAARVKGTGLGDAVVGIEVMNEPYGTEAELRALYEEVGAAIRAVDPKRLVFFEPNPARNLLDTSPLAAGPLSLPGTVYAPHVYTKVFSPACDEACKNTFGIDDLRVSNESARLEAESWQAPLLVGEWGFGPGSARYADYVSMQLELQDDYLASSAYWLWKENSEGAWGFFDWDEPSDAWSERAHVRKAFARPFARAIAGWPKRVRWDAAGKALTVAYRGDATVSAPTIVHVPLPEDGPASWIVTCDGAPVTVAPDARGDLAIPCGGPGDHRVTVRAEGA